MRARRHPPPTGDQRNQRGAAADAPRVTTADIVNKSVLVGAATTDGAKFFTSAAEEGLHETIDPPAIRMRLLSNPSWQDLIGFVLSLGALTLMVILLLLLGWDTLRHSITIETISVPKSLAENAGFSSGVASQRLQDAIDKAFAQIDKPSPATRQSAPPASSANRDADLFVIPGQRANFSQNSDLPSITLPAVGTSLDSFATTIQTFFGLERRTVISGEFTLFQNHLGLV